MLGMNLKFLVVISILENIEFMKLLQNQVVKEMYVTNGCCGYIIKKYYDYF